MKINKFSFNSMHIFNAWNFHPNSRYDVSDHHQQQKPKNPKEPTALHKQRPKNK